MTKAEDEAVDGLYDELVRAATAGDPENYAACFEDDAVLMPPHAPVVQGRVGIRAWATDFFKTYTLELATFSMKAQVIGDRAAFRRYEATGDYVAKRGGLKTPFEQKYLDALVRRSDGSWKFAAHMWSSSIKAKSIWD